MLALLFMEKNKPIIRIDSTALGTSHCILKFHSIVVEGLQEKKMNCSLVYGVAVHKFIQTMFESEGDFPTALAKAKEIFLRLPTDTDRKKPYLRDVTHLIATCQYVWSVQVMEEKVYNVVLLPNGKPAVEQTFHIKWFEDETCEIWLDGTIDSVGQFTGGVFAIRDWKTSSSWDTSKYFTQYERTRQLPIYTVACKRMAKDNPDSVLGKIGAGKMGAFIDAIFLKADKNQTSHGRSPIYSYTDEYLERVMMLLDDQCKKLSLAIKTGYLPQEGLINGTCMHAIYGTKCYLWNICKSNPQVAAMGLERDFIRKPFNPLEYNA